MSSNPLRLKYLLNKYLHNTCSRDELHDLWVLMSEISENDLIDAELQALWNNNSPEDNGADWDRLYARLRNQIEHHETDYTRISSYGKVKWIWKGLAIAAAVLICVYVSVSVFQKNTIVINNPSARTLTVAPKSVSCQVITLADGSSVTLNHNSHLSYPSAFSGKTRDVYLIGEAFFDIKHDNTKPFLVHTGAYIIKVLGTAFNIRVLPNEKGIAVTVARGKVQVQKQETKKILGVLLSGDQLTVKMSQSDKASDTVVQKKVDINAVLKWEKEELVFENITFDEAAMRLSHYFGIEIRFKNPDVKNCRFTANFQDENLENIVTIISKLTKSTYEKKNNIFWIDGKGCE